MTLNQLEYFRTAAQLGNFSKAAETSHISQPSLTIAIKKLESELGVALFLPNRRGAILTEAGRLLLEDVDNIFRQVDIATTHMSQYSHKNKAEIRIAYTSTVADFYIPHLIKDFMNIHSQYCIYSDEISTELIASGIKQGRYELGIGSTIPKDPEIEQIPIDYQRLCLILSNETTDTFDSVTSLEHYPFIGYRRDYPMFRLLESLFIKWNIHPDFVNYTYSESSIARLVEQKIGISIVAETDALTNYNIKILYPQWLNSGRYLYLIRHRTRVLSKGAEELQNMILSQSHI